MTNQPSTMQAKIMTVTPEIAKSFLDRNHMKQRNLSPSLVTHYAQQMTSNQWRLNGEPLIFDEDGNLLDGQHRLTAVIRSGVSCEMFLVEGVNHEAFPTINGGKPRSMANVMAIGGVANYSAVASCVSQCMNYRRALKTKRITKDKDGVVIRTEIGGSLSSYIRASKTDIMDEYNKHPDEYQKAVRVTMKCKHLANHSAFSVIAALAIIDGSRPEFVEGFFESIAKGLFESENLPEYQLRRRLESNKGSKTKISNNHTVLLIAKAWNFYATERECKVLKLSSESAFPIV